MSHSIDQINLPEDTIGEMVIPGEKANLVVECTLRHFMLHAQRNYSAKILECVPGMRVANHDGEDDLDVFNTSDVKAELVAVNFSFKPQEALKDFVENKGDEFFNELAQVVAYSDKRGLRGKRGVFITEFQRELTGGVEVLSAKIILSTTVFFNDYRATINYPSNQSEVDDVVEDIYNRITRLFPDVEIETSGVLVQELETA